MTGMFGDTEQPYTRDEVLGILGSLDRTHGKGRSPDLYIEVERRLIATVLSLDIATDPCRDSKSGLLASGEAARVVAGSMAVCRHDNLGHCLACPDSSDWSEPQALDDELRTGNFNFDLSYDAHRINWPRLWERVISSVINATFYGTLLVLAKMIGLM